MKVRVLSGIIALSVLMSACGSGAEETGSDDTVEIGILQIASAGVLDETVAAFEAELTQQLAPREVKFDLKNAQGDQSLITSLASTMADSDADAFAVIGTPLVIALAGQEKRRPVIALAMGDPVGSKVADSLEAPGGNVTGSVDFVDPALPLEQIMSIEPAPKTIGTIYDPSNPNMQAWIDAFREAVAEYPGLEIVESTVSGTADVSAAARSLAGRSDIQIIGPDVAAFAAMDVIGATALANRIPTYVIAGDPTVPGILASVGTDYPASGRRAADAAAEAINGTDPGTIPFSLPEGIEFTINQQTVDSLGIVLPESISSSGQVK
ncbi:ABC transporter substrate-binding protein [Rhodococcoides fascians]|uniref:ABC transporter substrate-binding protein n=1 Tax=Rhodococcoides fascians TaxID=1828 RepID=UPI000B037D8B|nr:ABC transporter substrate-binding protein [Rhodococcus fascians]